jgi:hypothetical protein
MNYHTVGLRADAGLGFWVTCDDTGTASLLIACISRCEVVRAG